MPSNFLSGRQAWKGFDYQNYYDIFEKNKHEKNKNKLLLQYQRYKDEYKVSYSCSKLLGLFSCGLS
jgi:hypothetical protein